MSLVEKKQRGLLKTSSSAVGKNTFLLLVKEYEKWSRENDPSSRVRVQHRETRESIWWYFPNLDTTQGV